MEAARTFETSSTTYQSRRRKTEAFIIINTWLKDRVAAEADVQFGGIHFTCNRYVRISLFPTNFKIVGYLVYDYYYNTFRQLIIAVLTEVVGTKELLLLKYIICFIWCVIHTSQMVKMEV
jgi:hypothetical protein